MTDELYPVDPSDDPVDEPADDGTGEMPTTVTDGDDPDEDDPETGGEG